jgi:hypothetical protein
VANLGNLIESGVSRRKFLAGVGASAGAVAALNIAGCGGSTNNGVTVMPTIPTQTPTDADILNFALNLEYLEASFYLYAATGSGLQASDTTAGSASSYQTVGTVTAGDAAQVSGLTPAQQDILNEIAFEEQAHVRFLRSALGSAAIPMPDIDLSFFGPLAVAATITTAATGAGSFNPFSSFDYFLVGAFIFEDVGVTAYSGAAPALTSPANLNYAAGILAVEAYHAAYVRTTITAIASTVVSGAQPNASLLTIANQVSTLRATLGGGNETALTLAPITLPTSGNYAPTSIVAASTSAAVAFARTPQQVLAIVYGTATANAASGGFFPSGLNGNVKIA